ncbi:hypothetical protein COLO4_02847 [Corchorus olitorius]|uniref:Uncharacterized protein n=1 Tax=Corchorus olitorius TaxID=93759 RepID=A0A1R3L0B3_9ROSI|nr:hypothetical protein COLO4_02847 [Corchorus olitorius]
MAFAEKANSASRWYKMLSTRVGAPFFLAKRKHFMNLTNFKSR